MGAVELESDGQRPLVTPEAAERKDLPLVAFLELFHVVQRLFLRRDAATDQDVHGSVDVRCHLPRDIVTVFYEYEYFHFR